MDKTNYTVLSLVAIVALTAIVSMFLQERAPDGLPTISFTSGSIAGGASERTGTVLTGNVVAGSGSRSEPVRNRYDLNGNNRIDAGDAEVLGRVIDRVEFCPRNAICDWNSDNILDTQDLILLNAEVLRQGEPVTSNPPAASEPFVDDAYAIATTGGVY